MERRGVPCSANLPSRGTLASRRSTVAVLGLGAALLSPTFAPDRLQRAPRSQVVVPSGRLPGPPEASGYEPPAAGRHASLRVYFRQAIEFYGFSVGRAEPSALASTPTHGGCPQARSISAFAACRATPAMPARA